MIPLLAAIVLGQDALPATLDRGITDALYIAGLSRRDLKVEQVPSAASPLVKKFLEDPNAVIAWAFKELTFDFAALRELYYGESSLPSGSRSVIAIDFPDGIPANVRPKILQVAAYVHEANEEVRQALSGLEPPERRELIEGLPTYAWPVGRLEFIRDELSSWARLRTLLARADLRRLRHAGERLQTQIQGAVSSLVNQERFFGIHKFSAHGMTIVIGGMGSDVHDDRDAQLTLDFGGNDHYSGRHGAGIGYAAVSIDLAGNDTYDLPDLSLGAGVLGIGVALDLRGSDLFVSKALSMGAGIAGFGSFQSAEGTDAFESGAMSQGFGFYGVGAFRRFQEGIGFRAGDLSQGSALEQGVGWFEASQDGIFQAGSRSQGFGGTAGPHSSESGGLGVCRVGSGTFRAVREAQGAGVGGGMGLFLAGTRRTSLDADSRAQGFGDLGGIGLVRASGSFGARSQSQGFGVESGLGMLVSPSNIGDRYELQLDRQGYGAYGGLGILLDLNGSDRYLFGAREVSTQLEQAGIGIALDMAGGAFESILIIAPSALASPAWSIRGFLEPGRQDPDEPPLLPLQTPKAPANPAEVGRAVAEATGEAWYATPAIRAQARTDLELAPGPLTDWALSQTRLLRPSEARLVAALAGDLERRRIIASETPNALTIMAEGRWPAAGPAVLAALTKPATARAAARAAAALNLQQAASDLMVLCASADGFTKRSAAIALARVGGAESLATAQVLLSDPDPVVRRAAAELYGRVPTADLATLANLASNGDEASSRSAVQALGRIGSPEALALVGARLGDTRAGVRIEALKELNGRCPVDFRARLDELRTDPDLRVRWVAAAISP